MDFHDKNDYYVSNYNFDDVYNHVNVIRTINYGFGIPSTIISNIRVFQK